MRTDSHGFLHGVNTGCIWKQAAQELLGCVPMGLMRQESLISAIAYFPRIAAGAQRK